MSTFFFVGEGGYQLQVEQRWRPHFEVSLILAIILAMTSLKKPKAAADDLEAEAEKAFQRAAAQQIQNGDDFDSEFEGAFQNPSALKSNSSVTKVSAGNPEITNGPTQLPVKTEGLPSSLPSSQG